MMRRDTTIMRARQKHLETLARYIHEAARQGGFGDPFVPRRYRCIPGPRAGVLEFHAGAYSGKMLKMLTRDDAALLRQFVPWRFLGDPCAYMSGRLVHLEAGWPDHLAETMIRLSSLAPYPKKPGQWIAGRSQDGGTIGPCLDDATPHFLVSGTTGSGKSVALRSAVLQLSQDPDNALVLIDGKFGEGLGMLAHLPGVVGPVAVDGPSTRATLGWTCAQMRERYTAPDRQGRVVVVFDEFQELAADQVVVALLRKLAAQGRAAGVNLIAATQHPTIDAFGDASTRRNLTGKVALRVGDPDASRVAVGGRLPRADYLLGSGDSFSIRPGAVHRVQIAFVDQRDVDQVGVGEWRFDEWPEYDAGDVGLDLPSGFVQSRTAEAVSTALIAAVEDEGRLRLQRRMEALSQPVRDNNRASALVKFGREVLTLLQDQEYEVTYMGAYD